MEFLNKLLIFKEKTTVERKCLILPSYDEELKEIKSVAYSPQGSQIGQLYFYN